MPNPILNKGGAGISISRAETVERLNPIARELSRLSLFYRNAMERLSHEDVAQEIDRHLRRGYMDVGKLSETILSNGGTPYNATDLEPQNFVLEGADTEMLDRLQELEAEFQRLVQGEAKIRHHIRTQAILLNVQTNSQERLNYLKNTLRSIGQHV